MPEKNRKLRILWMSNGAHTTTGYGVQTKYAIKILKELGCEVAVFSFWGLQGARTKINGTIHYPSFDNPFGNDVAYDHYKDWRADLLISLMDVWVLDPRKFGSEGIRYAPYFPVDHSPLPRRVADTVEEAYKPIVFSHFAEKEMLKAGLNNFWYIPHATDTKVYHPLDRVEAKKQVRLDPKAFIAGMVATNKGYPSRKSLPEVFEAFSYFSQKHDDAYLVLHTRIKEDIDLNQMAKFYGIQDFVMFSDQYQIRMGYPEKEMNKFYNAIDVLLSPSMWEGFGVPIIEAQATGTPVILTNFSSMHELCGVGWLVPPAKAMYTPMESTQVYPSVPKIVEALEECYNGKGRTEKDREMARNFACQYDIERVKPYWASLIEEVKREVGIK